MIIHTFDASGRELTVDELGSLNLVSPEIQNIFGEVISRIMDAEEEPCERGDG